MIKKLTFKRQMQIGIGCVVLGFICSEIFKNGIFSNIAWVIYGILFVINPVFPKNAVTGKNGKMWMRAAGILIVVWGLTSHFGVNDTYLDALSEEIGINIAWGNVVESEDSHGGFHGDGIKIMVIQFTETRLEEQMSTNELWNTFPVPDELEKIIYGKTEGTSTEGPYIDYDSVGTEIPEIANGYYYIKDRHSEATDSYDYSKILGRGSLNFTLLVYDCETDLLYICEMDT